MSGSQINRRGFLIGSGSAGVLVGLAACGSGSGATAQSATVESSSAGSSSSAGLTSSATPGSSAAPAVGGSFTDARGKKIAIPTDPAVVVAQSSAAAALWDAGYQVKGAYGELKKVDGKLNYQAGALDLAKITVIGNTYGDFDVEKYAALNPQLLIDLSFDNKTLWYVPGNSAAQIEALAPSLGIKMLGFQLPAIIEEFVTLAQQLGADPASSATAKTDFDEAVTAVRKATTATPDLKVLVVSRAVDKVYVADPKAGPDLAHLASLGVKFVGPNQPLKPTDYFQELSWEQIGAFAADVILYDAREVPGADAAAQKTSTWAALPAVKAGQLYPWFGAAPYSYRTFAPLYTDFADRLTKATKLI